MKYIITERQYKIITEQTDDIDWLIDWFKKVPEEKLKRTFTTKDPKGNTKTMSRDEILKVLSDKSKIMIITDPAEKKRLGLDNGLGQFRRPYLNPKPGDAKYFGKVVISGDWKNIIKTNPMYKDAGGLDVVKHHEQTHQLQYQQGSYDKGEFVNDKSKWYKNISGFCKFSTNSFCKREISYGFGYYNRPEEIYSHLFTIREILGIQPTDIVTYANATIKNKTARINVSVSRNGRIVQLPTKTMDTESSTFISIYCCNNSFKQTLMYLHNTLAKNDNPNNFEQDKMV